MFRSNLEGNGQNDNFVPFHSLSGLNLNLGLQDLYLETCNMAVPPPSSVSSSTLSPPSTPLTPEPCAFGSQSQFPVLTDTSTPTNQSLNMNATMLGAALTAGNQSGGSSAGGLANTLLLQRQYQYHLLIQQHQQQIALAQHNLALAASAVAVNHPKKDEIANSLKMFAMLQANTTDNGHGSTQEIMQDFATNGYVSDDFSRLPSPQPMAAPQQQQPQQPPPQQRHLPVCNATTAAAAATPQPLTAASHFLNFSNYQHFQNAFRSMSYMPINAASLAAAAALNVSAVTSGVTNNNNAAALGLGLNMSTEHIRNTNQQMSTKMHKRNNNKANKDQATRHCVFCENNNEPEAVVNSHTVRDTLGRVLCPKLRTYVCPICKASGDSAHTIKYCPKKPIVTMEDAIKAESFRLAKSTYYKHQMKI